MLNFLYKVPLKTRMKTSNGKVGRKYTLKMSEVYNSLLLNTLRLVHIFSFHFSPFLGD